MFFFFFGGGLNQELRAISFSGTSNSGDRFNGSQSSKFLWASEKRMARWDSKSSQKMTDTFQIFPKALSWAPRFAEPNEPTYTVPKTEVVE